MDSSLSHDPHAPDFPVEAYAVARWRRVGATDDEIHAIGATVGDLDSVSDNDLAEALANHRAAQEAQEPAQEPARGDDTTEADGSAPDEDQARHEAVTGPWVPSAEPLTVGDESYRCFDLAGGWVGALVGDPENGVHLVAESRDLLVDEIAQRIVGGIDQAEATARFQAAKHRADAAARAVAAAGR